MTDTPSERPDQNDAPESAAPHKAPEPPKRSYARVTEDTQRPGTPGAPGTAWGQPAPAATPGWSWSGSWVPHPGIIPLRPLGVGEIISGAFATLRRYWRVAFAITAFIALLSQVPLLATTYALSRDTAAFNALSADAQPSETVHQALTTIVNSGSFLGPVLLIDVITGACASGLLAVVVSRAVLGKAVTLREAWTESRPQLLRLFAVALTTAVVVGGIVTMSLTPALIASASGSSTATVSSLAMLLIPGLAVGLWAYITLSLAAPALMLERQGLRAALSRSARLVGGAWWRMLGITLLVGIIAALIGGVLAIPVTAVDLIFNAVSASQGNSVGISSLALDGVSGFLSATLTLPITATVPTLLYVDQRIRREALDIDLASAVGIPNYGASAVN